RALRHDQRIARAGLGGASTSETDTALRLRDWSLLRGADGYTARIPASGFTLELRFAPTQPVLLQGRAGLSRKGPDEAQASYYYSEPQLAAQGRIVLDGQPFAVRGKAWLDHEWSEALLHPEAVGWDWIGMNLDDGGALTAFHLRRADGSAPTGQVTGRLTPIAPATNVNLMPGNYLAATSGDPAAMESFGALDASFVDADGAPLKLAQGVSATVRIAPSSRSAALPPTVPLFFYNTATGLWVEEGSASLQGTAPNQYYEGTVTHFTTWNADQIYNTVRVNGCVQNAAGERVAGAVVVSEGKSYSGAGSAITDAEGKFSVPAKRSSEAFVVASKNAELSNAANATLGEQDLTLDGCLTLTSSAMSIKLTWGEKPYDLDAHTMGANVGEEVYFADKGSLATAPFVGLDVDDVDSFGPEYTTFAKLARNRTYRFFVDNYSRTYEPGQTGSPARVELSNRGAQSVFSPPAGEVPDSTRYWHVFDLRTDDNCNATVVPVQKFLANKPPEINTDANAQYCN
uniref:lipocalin-like domain-containing protein n=1 Tax=Variovorax paradoxus TaxID=34073 RepID=UPI002479BDC5